MSLKAVALHDLHDMYLRYPLSQAFNELFLSGSFIEQFFRISDQRFWSNTNACLWLIHSGVLLVCDRFLM